MIKSGDFGRLHGPCGAGVGARSLGGLVHAASLLTSAGTDGPGAEADNGCTIRESNTT